MFHKIKAVNELSDYHLSVRFAKGVTKMYEVGALPERWEPFQAMELSSDLFSFVAVNGGGCGIVWNDDFDLFCDELFENGETVKTSFDGLIAIADAARLWGRNNNRNGEMNMQLKTGGELWWGLSNLLIVVSAVVMILLLQREKENIGKVRSWQTVYFGFGLAALNGFVFHSFELQRSLTLGLWVIQYVFFYAAGLLFHLRTMSLLTEGSYPSGKLKRIRLIGTAVLAVLTIVLHLTLPDYEDALYVFIAFAAFLLIPILYLGFFGKHRSRPLKYMILVLVLSLLAQALSVFWGGLVVVGHIFDVLAMICGYRVALSDIRDA